MKRFLIISSSIMLISCTSVPKIHHSSTDSITVKYYTNSLEPKVTPEAMNMAVNHCKKYGKGAQHVSSSENFWTTEEEHTFKCIAK